MANRNKNQIKRSQNDRNDYRGNKRDKREERSSKPRNNNNRKDDQERVEKDEFAKYNKLAYYIPDPTLVNNATQLSYQSINGVTPMDDYLVPTIMKIYMNPSPGLTYQGANPGLNHPDRTGINMAGLKIFNLLSMSSGRNMAYGPQDVSTAILAMSQLLAMHGFVHRLFQSVKVWNMYNRMFPKAMITAMGIDYNDFITNLSDYRTRYNALIAAANQLPIILNLGFLKKSIGQYSYIFTDSDSPLSQTYVYLPESTWIIDETSYSGGTILHTISVCPKAGTTRTFADLMITVLRPMVDALLTSSTLNLVYADLLNFALKSSEIKFTSLDFITEEETILPTHNWEALVHIHNLETFGSPDYPTYITTPGREIYTPLNDVYPSPGTNALIYNPARSDSVLGISGTDKVNETIVFDSPVADPDPELRLEISRYSGSWTENVITESGVNYHTFTVVPDYYATTLEIIQVNAATPLSGIMTRYKYGTTPTAVTKQMSQFDWHPIIKEWSGSDRKIKSAYGDLNYWTVVDVRYIERLNELVYMGLFTLSNGE